MAAKNGNDNRVSPSRLRVWVDSVWQDGRFAVRNYRHNPVFSTVAVVSLALGIAVASAIYSLVDSVLFRPLPFDQPERIVRVLGFDVRRGADWEVVPEPVFRALRQAVSLDVVSSYNFVASLSLTLTTDAKKTEVRIAQVSPAFFQVLGVMPALGRPFRPDDETPGNDQVVILTYDLWQRQFAGDPRVVGRDVQFEEGIRTVVGVMAKDFWYPSLWASIAPQALTPTPVTWTGSGSEDNLFVPLGRLKPGVSLSAFRAEADLLAARVMPKTPDGHPFRLRVLTLQEHLDKYHGRTLRLLLAAILCLLLTACVNVANLLLARGGSRQVELAVRASLGAGRGRLFRQLFTEAAFLALAAGVLGVIGAKWLLGILLILLPERLQAGLPVEIDGRVLAFALTITTMSAVVFGMWPALAGSKADLLAQLRSRGTRSRRRRVLAPRAFLLALESGLAVVLLAAAALFVNSFIRFQGIDYGFRTDGLWAVWVHADEKILKDKTAAAAYHDRLAGALRAVPGVRRVAWADSPPIFGWETPRPVQPADRGLAGRAVVRQVSADYFGTLGLPLVRGRSLQRDDEQDAASVVVVNERLAAACWPGRPAVGQSLTIDGTRRLTVVGVVADARELSRGKPPAFAAYVPVAASRAAWAFLVRTGDAAGGLASSLTAAVERAGPMRRVTIRDYRHDLGKPDAVRLFYAALLSLFAGLALAFGALGVAGITAHTVILRRHELGVRLAVGATPQRLVRSLVTDSCLPIALGAAFGLVAQIALGRVLVSMLFEVTPRDPVTLASAALVLVLVAGTASYAAVRHAVHLDPIAVLRSE